MRQDGRFVRKQGLSRTGCVRTVSSYENRAFLVPDTPGQSVRTETRLIPYRMRQDSQFVRKQGVSRTGWVWRTGSYGNKAFPVPVKRYCLQNYNNDSNTEEDGRFSLAARRVQ